MSRLQPHLILADDPALPLFPLGEGQTRVGRASANEVSIRHRSISRLHLTLSRDGAEVRIHPASKNVTRVAGRPARTGQLLRDGETIRIGARELIFRAPELPADPPARLLPPTAPPPVPARRQRATPVWPVALGLLVLVGATALGTLALVGASREAQQVALTRQQAEMARLTRRIQAKEQALAGKDSELGRVGEQLARQRRAMTALRTAHDKAVTEARRTGQAQAAAAAERSRKLALARRQLKQLMADQARLSAERQRLAEQRDALVRQAKPVTPRTPAEQPSGRGAAADAMHRGRSVDTAGTRQAERVARTRSRADRRALVAAITQALDDYANPQATPRTLEPALGRLTAGSATEDAVALLRVYQHARELLSDLDRNMKFLDRRAKGMSRAAQASRGASDRPRRGRPQGAELSNKAQSAELNQRLMELYAKKNQIKQAQRRRLVALRDAVCQAFGRMTAQTQTRYLADRFEHERDPVQRTAILRALEAGRARHAIPVLIGKLSIRDDALVAAIRRALVAIAGVDAGAQKRDWQGWWEKNKDL